MEHGTSLVVQPSYGLTDNFLDKRSAAKKRHDNGFAFFMVGAAQKNGYDGQLIFAFCGILFWFFVVFGFCLLLHTSYSLVSGKRQKNGYDGQQKKSGLIIRQSTLYFVLYYYLFTWNLVSPSLKKALICLAAAIPALMLASAV